MPTTGPPWCSIPRSAQMNAISGFIRPVVPDALLASPEVVGPMKRALAALAGSVLLVPLIVAGGAVTAAQNVPPLTAPPQGGPIELAAVHGTNTIYVAASIAPAVQALLDAAAADGIKLGGGGYRSPEQQIALRRAHCGPTAYDIYDKPASQCRPPTARPGTSMHERGLAIDFTCNGLLIVGQRGVCFQWLSRNAGPFGLRNFEQEPWHWSTTGS